MPKTAKIAEGGQYKIGVHKASLQYTKKLKDADGKWRVKYLGKVGGPAALRAAEKKWRELIAEAKADSDDDAGDKLSVGEAVDAFLAYKRSQGISEQNYEEYERLCRIAYEALKPYPVPMKDLKPRHYEAIEIAIKKGNPNSKYYVEQYAPTSLKTKFNMVRAWINWVARNRTFAVPRYGDYLTPPSKRELRGYRHERERAIGKKFFEASEIRAMLALPDLLPRYRAAILLGINCGFIERDCCLFDPADVTGNILSDLRPKTNEYRRAILWQETLDALAELEASGDKFPTGRGWLARYFTNHVQIPAGVYRRHRGFSALRHSFFTTAKVIDKEAAKISMGHVAYDEIEEAYTEGIEDSRLHAVSNAVHRWLFGGE